MAQDEPRERDTNGTEQLWAPEPGGGRAVPAVRCRAVECPNNRQNELDPAVSYGGPTPYFLSLPFRQ